MSKVKFNADEMMVMAMFEQPTRTETMRYIEEVVPFVEDDVEVFSLVASTMKKMRSISDMEFSRLDLKPYTFQITGFENLQTKLRRKKSLKRHSEQTAYESEMLFPLDSCHQQ